MPSGRSVTAQVLCSAAECVMNVVVHALAQDRRVSRGLCGNFDGVADNDITQAQLPFPGYPREPVDFTKHFL